jgi:bacterioferritin (cytochrome b1)
MRGHVMDEKQNIIEETMHILVERLNHALHIEYTFIIHYPYIAGFIHDDEARNLAIELGTASIHHADIIASIISELGGKPNWAFEPFPGEIDLNSFFQNQIAREKRAMELHRGSAEIAASTQYGRTLNALADEEAEHIKNAERILLLLHKK